jgi:hypothetical protein
MGMRGKRHAPAALYPRERTPGTTMEAGRASELIWTQMLEEKPFTSAEDRTSVVQSVVRHYIDWTAPALVENLMQYLTSTTVFMLCKTRFQLNGYKCIIVEWNGNEAIQ